VVASWALRNTTESSAPAGPSPTGGDCREVDQTERGSTSQMGRHQTMPAPSGVLRHIDVRTWLLQRGVTTSPGLRLSL
jgi:hypothetical protein